MYLSPISLENHKKLHYLSDLDVDEIKIYKSYQNEWNTVCKFE